MKWKLVGFLALIVASLPVVKHLSAEEGPKALAVENAAQLYGAGGSTPKFDYKLELRGTYAVLPTGNQSLTLQIDAMYASNLSLSATGVWMFSDTGQSLGTTQTLMGAYTASVKEKDDLKITGTLNSTDFEMTSYTVGVAYKRTFANGKWDVQVGGDVKMDSSGAGTEYKAGIQFTYHP